MRSRIGHVIHIDRWEMHCVIAATAAAAAAAGRGRVGGVGGIG